MKQKLELMALGLIAGLLAAYVTFDDGAKPASANDSGGKISVIVKAGQNASDNFFLVDTDRKWIGLYTITNNTGPRLVSAHNYQLADALSQVKMDSFQQSCENQNGWSVKESNDNLEIIEKQIK